jgi:diaminopimelate decarboxylase
VKPKSQRADSKRAPKASPWSAGTRFTAKGLEIAGVAATDLIDEFGTPLVVLDEDDLRARARGFASLFPRALYAVKAFTSRFVIQTVASEGMDLLVATGNELDACLRAGVAGSRIAFHGNNKSDSEIEFAINSRVSTIIIDNTDELERVASLAKRQGRRQSVLIRVTPGIAAPTHASIQTGSRGSKFGVPIEGEEAARAIRRGCNRRGLEVAGIHFHLGSQVLVAEPLVEAIEAALDVSVNATRDGLHVLDLGGGIGVRYTDEEPLEIETIAGIVLEAVARGAKTRGIRPPRVWVEPGRAVVANSAITLYRVGSRKHMGASHPYLAVDGGMSDNIRPALYGARYTVALANRGNDEAASRFTIVGKHCESGDVLAEGVDLPSSVASGDVVAFAATGAYTYSMASNYNRLGRPGVVSVRNGGARVILRRENLDDLDRLEVLPPVGL